jgi:hypothetical protein
MAIFVSWAAAAVATRATAARASARMALRAKLCGDIGVSLTDPGPGLTPV